MRTGDDPATAGVEDSALRLQVLGPLRLWRGGSELPVGPPQQAQLLALLLARSGAVTPVTSLVDALWGESAPPSAVNTIHKRIGSIRRLLEPGLSVRDNGSYVERRNDGYIWLSGSALLDLDTFRARIADARELHSVGMGSSALDLYSEGLRLWVGPAGAGMTAHPATASIFSTLNAEFVNATLSAAELAITLGRPDLVLAPLELAATANPLNEEVQSVYMSALDTAGRRAEALAIFIEVRNRLVEDLGIDPGHGLVAAYRRIVNSYSSSPQADRDIPMALGDRSVVTEPYRVADFSGRSAELERVRGFMFPTEGTSPTSSALLVTGPPGVGKTTTVLEAIHRSGPHVTRLFVDLHGFDEAPLSPLEVLRSLLAQVNPHDAPPTNLDDAAAAWRAASGASAFVVLLDNASSESQVRPVLAVEASLRVIITSRRTLPGLEATERLPLGPLPRPESVSFLAILVGHSRIVGTRLDELAGLCGDLPLALRIAGARIASRPQWSIDDFIARLQDERKRLRQLVAGDLAVETAFSLSYRALHPTTRALFRSLAVLHEATFGADMVAAIDGLDPDTVRDQLDVLADLGLLENIRGDRYRIHDLLRIYADDRSRAELSARERRAQKARLDQWVLERTSAAARTFPDVWLMVPTANSETHGLEAAQTWLTTEAGHWYGSLKRAALGGEHRLVVDTTMALAGISSVWEHFAGWTHVHSAGVAAASALDDRESHVRQLLALAIAVAAENPGEGDAELAARRALEAAQSLDSPRWVAWARSLLADALSSEADDTGALREYRIAQVMFHELGDLNGELETRSWMLNTLSLTDPDQATVEAEHLIMEIDGLGAEPERSLNSSTLINVYSATARHFLSQKRYEDALVVSARMSELREPVLGGGGYSARASFIRGFALLGLERFDEARVALQSALSWERPYLPESWGARLRDALASIPRED